MPASERTGEADGFTRQPVVSPLAFAGVRGRGLTEMFLQVVDAEGFTDQVEVLPLARSDFTVASSESDEPIKWSANSASVGKGLRKRRCPRAGTSSDGARRLNRRPPGCDPRERCLFSELRKGADFAGRSAPPR